MSFELFAIAVAAAFFSGSLILLNYGRFLGLRYLKRKGSIAGFAATEGAVFGLIGLLLAFTISGALQRWDDRRQLVVQEANAVATAYDRLALFEAAVAPDLQDKLKNYVLARIEFYRTPHDFSPWKDSEEIWSSVQKDKTDALRDEIWDAAVAACPSTNFRPACLPALTALNNAFEVARLRLGALERHPPQVIYAMLFGLGLGGSLLAGFGMAAATVRSWVHMISFAGALAVALYAVTDVEFPRLGLVRVDSSDHFLVDAYNHMR
jgi:hypothetical protein